METLHGPLNLRASLGKLSVCREPTQFIIRRYLSPAIRKWDIRRPSLIVSIRSLWPGLRYQWRDKLVCPISLEAVSSSFYTILCHCQVITYTKLISNLKQFLVVMRTLSGKGKTTACRLAVTENYWWVDGVKSVCRGPELLA